MLAKLDKVEWSALEHAYGPASDVPAMLRAITNGKVKSLRDLIAAVNHQGGPSHDVATRVVPFLWEIARDGPRSVRAPVLVALGDLAAGGDHEAFLGTGITKRAPEAWLALEKPGATLRKAVERGVATAVALLEDTDPAMRSAAAFVCAVAGAKAAPAKIAAMLAKEKNEAVVADQLVALAWLGAVPATTKAATARIEHASPIVRAHAAIALATLGTAAKNSFERIRPVLATATRTKTMPVVWAHGRVAAHATACSSAIGGAREKSPKAKTNASRAAPAPGDLLERRLPDGTTVRAAWIAACKAKGDASAPTATAIARTLGAEAVVEGMWLAHQLDVSNTNKGFDVFLCVLEAVGRDMLPSLREAAKLLAKHGVPERIEAGGRKRMFAFLKPLVAIAMLTASKDASDRKLVAKMHPIPAFFDVMHAHGQLSTRAKEILARFRAETS